MVFAYYGAKHGLAKKYPAPQHNIIIEPFAGSAAYSVRWATESTKVLLFDADPQVVALWERVKQLTPNDLQEITYHALHDERTTDPLVAASAGSDGLKAALNDIERQITPRMRKDWPNLQRRIERAMTRIQQWEIVCDTYSNAPDIKATWFIDPPYQPLIDNKRHSAGNAYNIGANNIDYKHLGEWCQQRRGQIIVCEQHPAQWLPFTPFHQQLNAQNIERTEVIWTNTPLATAIQETLL
jgi:site-specific DNA-adenine methylase